MSDPRTRFKQYYRAVRLGRKESQESRDPKPGILAMQDICNGGDYHEPTMSAAIRASFGAHRLRRGAYPQAVETINNADSTTPRDSRVAPRPELIQIYLRAVRYRRMEWERGSNYRINTKFHLWAAHLADLEANEKATRYGLTNLPPITVFQAQKPGDIAKAWAPTIAAHECLLRHIAPDRNLTERQAMEIATDFNPLETEYERRLLAGEYMEANEYP